MSHAATFHALHHSDSLLILPNAWDAASARLVEAAGARAIATSSAAVAWAHGHADGEQIALDTLLAAVREIVRVVKLPVTVDLEAGYAATPEAIADPVAAVLATGAVGVNLEDGTSAPELLAAKIGAAKHTAAKLGQPLFINARADVYLRNLAAGDAAVAETVRRGRIYREAGADGLFVPALVDPAAVAAVVREVPLPLNLLVRPSLGPVAELERLGVRRLSLGCSLAQAALGAARAAVRELLDRGSYGALFAQPVPVAELNGWFAR
jgi:2-methylisocitrate lyase-like PEP mutase family enzyme